MDRRSFLLTAAALGTACRRAEHSTLCFAAASTTEALTELGRGRNVRFSWGGSGDLARQILAGAPADLFLSADEARVDALQKAGLVSSRRDLLSNRLVVVVPKGSTAKLATAADLASLSRVAMGDPATVPAGTYGKQWLERAGVWGSVSAHVVPTLDVRAALAAVEDGAADAAIVYRTDATLAKNARIAWEPGEQPRIVYPLAVLSRADAAAVAFADHLASDAARAVFARYGFSFP